MVNVRIGIRDIGLGLMKASELQHSDIHQPTQHHTHTPTPTPHPTHTPTHTLPTYLAGMTLWSGVNAALVVIGCTYMRETKQTCV